MRAWGVGGWFAGRLSDGLRREAGGGNSMVKPGDFCHFQGDALRKCCFLALQVDEEGAQPLPNDDLDSTVRNVGLVERHGVPRAK